MTVFLGVVVCVILTIALLFLTIIESAIAQPSPLALRVLAEKSAESRYKLLEEIVRDRNSFLLPIQYCSQLVFVTISVLTVALYCLAGTAAPFLFSLITLLALVSVFRVVIPRIWTFRNPERVLLQVLPSFGPVYRLLSWVSFPVAAILSVVSGAGAGGSTKEREEETTEEEIQAYLDVGEEEGIFESTETRLIQSALEFGTTSVREIMTPRGEIVAIEKRATFSSLRAVISDSKHSRIPVYSERIDEIEGVVHARSLLAQWDVGGEDGSIAPLVKDILIVPETKNVSQLLKEFQERAEQMAIVVNEYGTVSGLVTVEDLLEEIVGEIHDEDDLRNADMIYDGAGSYIVRGSVDVGDLEDVLGVDYGDHDFATISGLIVGHLGRVPASGETIVMAGTAVEIMSADLKRIRKLKVSLLSSSDEAS